MSSEGGAGPTVAPGLLVVAGGSAARMLGTLGEAAGMRLLGVVAPAEAPDRLAMTLRMDALLLDLRRQGADEMAAIADALRGHCATQALMIADLASIDEAMALLDGVPAEWLCESEPAELAAGVALLAHRAGLRAPHADVREEGAADGRSPPLETLSAEVRRLAQVIERLTDAAGQEPIRRALGDGRRDYGAPPPHREAAGNAPAGARGAAPSGLTPQALHDLLRARRLRDRFFVGGLFADPAWDIMLDLMAARLAGERVSVSSLCIAAAVPPTTALRWIRQLTERGVLRRIDDPEDGRRVFIELGDEAAQGMSAWWAAVGERGQDIPPGT